jgi:hypothetical protein
MKHYEIRTQSYHTFRPMHCNPFFDSTSAKFSLSIGLLPHLTLGDARLSNTIVSDLAAVRC